MQISELNKNGYDAIAEYFSASRSFVWPDMKFLAQFVKDNDRVLDLGCGNGRLLEVLTDKKVDYLGADNSEELLLCARAKFPEQKFIFADFLTLEKNEALIGQKFDVIFLISSFNHLPKEKHFAVLIKIKSLLKPGGYLLMINWNLWNLFVKKSIWRKNEFRKEAQGILQTEMKKQKFAWRDLLTVWQSGSKKVVLYYYAFTRRSLAKLLKDGGFEIIKNFYSIKNRVASIFCGRNIVTVARNKHDFLIKKKSKIQGLGIFTLRKIKQNENFYQIPLRDLHYENYKRHAYVGNGQYVCDENILNFVNHSCRPNIKLDIERIDPTLIALRDIEIGEELSCNYNATEKCGVFCQCRCGADNCGGSFGKKKVFEFDEEDFE